MLEAAFNCPTFSDYTIINSSNDDKIHLHRVVLNTIPYFQSLLSSQTSEAYTRSLYLSSQEFSTAYKILHFLYARRIPSGGSMTSVEWLDLLALAEMWQYHELIVTCMPVIVRLIVCDWCKNLSSLHDLMDTKYQNIITWFFSDQFFLDNILHFFSENPVPQEVWDVVAHPKYPFNEVLRSGSGHALVEWMKTHSLTQGEALFLQQRPIHDPTNYGMPNDYIERSATPDHDYEDDYYDQYPDSP